MSKTRKFRPRGGVLLIIFAAVGGAGLAYDLLARPAGGFWFVGFVGANAWFALAAAALSLALAWLTRLFLTRRGAQEGGGDANPHP